MIFDLILHLPYNTSVLTLILISAHNEIMSKVEAPTSGHSGNLLMRSGGAEIRQKRIEEIISSPKRLGLILFIATFILAVPFTLSLLKQQQARKLANLQTHTADVEMCAGGSCVNQNNQYTDPNGNVIAPSGPVMLNPVGPTIAGGANPNQYYQGGYNPYQNPAQSQPGQNNVSNQGNMMPQMIAQGDNCTADGTIDAEEATFIRLLNQYRGSNGLTPVTVSGNASKIAAWMAQDSANRNYLGHVDSLGRDPQTRMNGCGDPYYNQEINAKGENDPSAQNALNGYKASPEHNAAMLNPQNVQAGIARVLSGNFSFWVIDFNRTDDGSDIDITNITPPPSITITQPVVTQPVTTITQPVVTVTQPATSPSATAVPSGATLAVSVKITGIGTNATLGEIPSPTVTTKAGFVRLIDVSTQAHQDLPAVFTYQSSGIFTSSVQAPAGTFDIKVKLDNTLWKEIGILPLTAAQSTTATQVTPTLGDINGDNKLDLTDYNAFLSCYGNKTCSEKALADLNLDGKVDELDLNIFYSTLAKREGD